ncbi:MAG: HEPN domain-containing protein [Solirubrobacterales bacterium]
MSAVEPSSAAIPWLELACGDLVTAEAAQKEWRVPARNVAFHAQQAVEKAIKAALVLEGKAAPRSHDLDDLRNRLPPGWRIKSTHRDLSRLTQYAVEARYPDDLPPINKLQSSASLRQAQTIYRSVRGEFERRGLDLSTLDCV